MSRVVNGPIHVDYGQAYVHDRSKFIEHMGNHFRGQVNGLCGAAVPGTLFMITGLHTGKVGFTVDISDAPQPIDDTWEEIVEAAFLVDVTVDNLALVEWGGSGVYPIPLTPGSYRVRYCASGMQLGHDHGVVFESDDIVDFYALMFWPAEAASDCVIKQTTWTAAYWHKTAIEMGQMRKRHPTLPVLGPGIPDGSAIK
jgi:hypothetical protein